MNTKDQQIHNMQEQCKAMSEALVKANAKIESLKIKAEYCGMYDFFFGEVVSVEKFGAVPDQTSDTIRCK